MILVKGIRQDTDLVWAPGQERVAAVPLNSVSGALAISEPPGRFTSAARGLAYDSSRLTAVPPVPDEGEDCPREGPERTVLGRAAAIMDAFEGDQHVLSLAELSERTQLPKSTLDRKSVV